MLAFPLLVICALHFHSAQAAWVPMPCKSKIRGLADSIHLKLNFAVHQKVLKQAYDAGWVRAPFSTREKEKAVDKKIREITSQASIALNRDLGIQIYVNDVVFPREDTSRSQFLSRNASWSCPLASSRAREAQWGDLSQIHDWAAARSGGRREPGMWVYLATGGCGMNLAGSYGGLGHKKGPRMSNTILFTSLFGTKTGAWQRLLHELGHHMVGKHTFGKYPDMAMNAPNGLMQYSWVPYEGQLGRFYSTLGAGGRYRGHKDELCYSVLHSLHQFASANKYVTKLGPVRQASPWYFPNSGVIYRSHALPISTMYFVTGQNLGRWDKDRKQPESKTPPKSIPRTRSGRAEEEYQMIGTHEIPMADLMKDEGLVFDFVGLDENDSSSGSDVYEFYGRDQGDASHSLNL